MTTKEIVTKYEAKKENLLQILHEIQDTSPHNYLSDENMKEIADLLNITYAQVYGVVTYYSMLSHHKRGRNIIRVCNSPVCHMKESKNIIESIEKELQIYCGETTSDLLFTIEKSECLGNCDSAPAMMINQEIFGNLNPEITISIIDRFKKNEKK